MQPGSQRMQCMHSSTAQQNIFNKNEHKGERNNEDKKQRCVVTDDTTIEPSHHNPASTADALRNMTYERSADARCLHLRMCESMM